MVLLPRILVFSEGDTLIHGPGTDVRLELRNLCYVYLFVGSLLTALSAEQTDNSCTYKWVRRQKTVIQGSRLCQKNAYSHGNKGSLFG